MALADIQMKSEDFLEKSQLNAGGFGTVSLCYHKSHGLVVLKTVYTGPKRTECNTSLLEEGMIMHKLNHDRVVKLLGVILEDGNYSLVIEYIRKGDLMSVLKATPIFLPVKGRFVLETIEGMLYLTEQGLVHKDLKPENILVDEDFHIKIADLGVACFKNWSRLTKEETSRQRKIKQNSKTNAGTLSYMAPEHLQDINAVPDVPEVADEGRQQRGNCREAGQSPLCLQADRSRQSFYQNKPGFLLLFCKALKMFVSADLGTPTETEQIKWLVRLCCC